MKAMKAIAVFILLSVFMVGRLLAQTDIKEQIVVPLSEPGKPFKIVAHVIYSGIKVVGYEGKDVVITVSGESGRKRESSEASGGMKRIGGNAGGDITAEE